MWLANGCQLPLSYIYFTSAWWHYWNKLVFFLFAHGNVLSMTLVGSAWITWYFVGGTEEQIHHFWSIRKQVSTGMLSPFRRWGQSYRPLHTSFLPEEGIFSIASLYHAAARGFFNACPKELCWKWSGQKGKWLLNLLVFYRNNGCVFCRFNTECSWEIFEEKKKLYDQWSMPNHKTVLLKKKKIGMHHRGRRNFSVWLYDVLCGWLGLLCCSISISSRDPVLRSISHAHQPEFNPRPARLLSKRSSNKITNYIFDRGLLTTSSVLFRTPFKIHFSFYYTFKFYSSGYRTINVCISYRLEMKGI